LTINLNSFAFACYESANETPELSILLLQPKLKWAQQRQSCSRIIFEYMNFPFVRFTDTVVSRSWFSWLHSWWCAV